MNVATLFKAVDALIAFRDAAKRFKANTPPPADAAEAEAPASAETQGLAGQIEARLTNVVVAALKEAFDRDHARLEMERGQLDEERRRAEAALAAELRRQAVDRELARLRLLAGAAMVGWIASVALVTGGLASATVGARVVLALGWLLLLGALGAAFTAQGRIGASRPHDTRSVGAGAAGVAALWLLIAGLAATAVSLLL
ncbi:MAG: hypothetical protein ACRD3C_07505 [Vicinamibacterales bacterium]